MSLCVALLFFVLCLLNVLADCVLCFFFLMIRRPPRSTLDRSSAASDVYKRQELGGNASVIVHSDADLNFAIPRIAIGGYSYAGQAVSYTHLRAHETVLDLVCRLLLEKKKLQIQYVLSYKYN